MSGSVHLAIAVLGPDRPGLVDAVSEFLFDCEANIEESRMTVLGAEFSVMLLIQGSETTAARVESDLPAFAEKNDLCVIVQRTAAPSARAVPGSLAYRLTATSLDHPGIVNRISHVLAQQGVNIERAECGARPGPWSGSPVFHLEMTLAIAKQAQTAALRDALAALGSDEGIDIELRAVPTQ
jgi:glycine cleavage system transcriptional repressor